MTDLLTLITLIVTALGWLVTWRTQRAIQKQARGYQRRDRDLAVYRARMEKASQLTRTLLENSDHYYKFSALAKTALGLGRSGVQFFQSAGLELLQERPRIRLEMTMILYDPEYRTLRDLLPERISKPVYDGVRNHAKGASDFSARAENIDWNGPNVQVDIQYLEQKGAELGDELTELADKFGDAFAHLDVILRSEDDKKPGKLKRAANWFQSVLYPDE